MTSPRSMTITWSQIFLDEREIVLDHDHSAPLRRELPDGMADPRAEHGIDASHRLVADLDTRAGRGKGRAIADLLAAAPPPHGARVLFTPEVPVGAGGPDSRPCRPPRPPRAPGSGD